MMDAISEERLSHVCPTLAGLVRKMSDILLQEQIVIRVVQGLRTWQEQDDLYAQGRVKPGKIVTKARGGYSYHNFGMAVDCAPDTNPLDNVYIPDWNDMHPTWDRMEEVGREVGLVSGAFWVTMKDKPHFQLNGAFPENAPNDTVRNIYKTQGIKAVWKAALIWNEDPVQ